MIIKGHPLLVELMHMEEALQELAALQDCYTLPESSKDDKTVLHLCLRNAQRIFLRQHAQEVIKLAEELAWKEISDLVEYVKQTYTQDIYEAKREDD